MARVPYASPETIAKIASGRSLSAVERILAWRPELVPASRQYESALEAGSLLAPLVRETAIMAVLRRSPPETARRLPKAKAAGLSAGMLEAIAEEDWTESSFSAVQKSVLRFAMLYDAGHGINEAVFSGVRENLSVPDIVELSALCSYYGGVARMAIAMGIGPDELEASNG